MGISNLYIADIATYLGDKIEIFDCIIARDVIENLERQEAFDILNLISSALKPGGTFIMTTPNGQGLFFTSDFYGDYTHEIPYTYKKRQATFFKFWILKSGEFHY